MDRAGERSSSIYELSLQCISHLGRLPHLWYRRRSMALPSKRHSGGSVGNWSSLQSLHQIPAREMALHHPVPKDDIIRKTANAPRPIRPRSMMKNRVCSIVGRIKISQWCFKLGCICSVPAGCTGAVAPLSYFVIRSTQSRFRPVCQKKNQG